MIAAGPLPEPVKRYRRVVDRLECPICGKRLGERSWDYRINNWSEIVYADSGPTYYRGEVIGSKVRTFKPCGCQVQATAACDQSQPPAHSSGGVS